MAVLKLLGEAEVTEQGKASKLDVRMKFLEESSPLGANHPAVKQYGYSYVADYRCAS